MTRVQITISGTATAVLSLDPLEFIGLDRREIAHEIRGMLMTDEDSVDWFPEEVDAAVDEVLNARGDDVNVEA